MFPVCGKQLPHAERNTLQSLLRFFGNTDTHYGIFGGCGTALPFDTAEVLASSDGSCC